MNEVAMGYSYAQKYKNKYKPSELVFCLAYIVYLVVSMLGTSLLGDVIGINTDVINTTKHIVAVLIILSLLLNLKFGNKLTYLLVGISMISLLVYMNMGAFNPFLAVLFLLGCRSSNPRRICKIHLYCVGGSLVLIFLSAILGFVENVEVSRIYQFDDTVRYCMGFRNATWFGYVFYLFIDYFYLKIQAGKKIKWHQYFIVMAVAVISYLLCKGRLDFFSTIVLILGVRFGNKIVNNRGFRRIIVFSFLFMCIISLVSTYLYTIGNPLAVAINRSISSRLKFNAMGMAQYGISLFGKYVEMQGVSQTTAENWWNYFYIDNFYISYLIQYGLIWMLLVLCFLTIINKRLASMNKGMLLIFMTMVAIHGYIVPTMMDFISSCTILFCFVEANLFQFVYSKRLKRVVLFSTEHKL